MNTSIAIMNKLFTIALILGAITACTLTTEPATPTITVTEIPTSDSPTIDVPTVVPTPTTIPLPTDVPTVEGFAVVHNAGQNSINIRRCGVPFDRDDPVVHCPPADFESLNIIAEGIVNVNGKARLAPDGVIAIAFIFADQFGNFWATPNTPEEDVTLAWCYKGNILVDFYNLSELEGYHPFADLLAFYHTVKDDIEPTICS